MKLQKKMIIGLILIIAVALSLSIIAWVIITPPHRVSKPDVTDRGEFYSGFFPTAVTPGFTDFDVWCDIENLGGSSSGVFNVTYYASTDTIISTEDYLIGMDTVSSISSLEYGDSMWSGVFPSSGIPYGVYFIGWIIDSEDNVNEFDETNNIFYISSYQLIVECTPGAPIDTPEDRIIKIGILADFTHITGEGTFQGSYLAIKGINEAGGILIHNSADPTFPNGTYYLGIVGENTYEAEPYLDITKGALAANKLITQHDPDFFIGGYRTEAVMTYREYIMDEHKIFMNTGASTDSFC
ncbi:MAG: CARDB domain-containing protein, partial [Promethearchaeota archaeon]